MTTINKGMVIKPCKMYRADVWHKFSVRLARKQLTTEKID